MSHVAVLLLEDGAKLVLEEEGAEKQRKCQSDLAKERFIGKSASFESKKILEIMYRPVPGHYPAKNLLNLSWETGL